MQVAQDKHRKHKQNSEQQITLHYRSVTSEHFECAIPADSELAKTIADMDRYWKSNTRANTRSDRHSSLSNLQIDGTWFQEPIDIEQQIINRDLVNRALSPLSDRDRFLIKAIAIEGYRYTDLARLEGKHESSIRDAYARAIKRARNNLEQTCPISGSAVA